MATWNRLRHLITWTGLILFVVGGKLWLIDTTGSSVPRWDQVDGEGEYVLRPWSDGEFKLIDAWKPHNEHRIVYTKLSTLGIVMLNGQWDAFVQMLVNAVLHAMLLPFLLSWIRPRVTGIQFALLALVGTALWVLPIAWENTLQGFQSQFYYLIWLSLLQIRGVFGSNRFDARWIGGQLCGLLVLGAMGSGLLSSLAVGTVVGVEMLRSRSASRWQITTLALSVLWTVLGWLSRTPFPGHDPLRVKSVGEFLDGMAQITTWPLQGWLPWALIFAAPMVIVMIRLIRQRERAAFEREYLGIAAWVTLIVVATVVYRYHGAILSSRYLDQFSFGLILQGVALAWLPLAKKWRTSLMVVWTMAVGFALVQITERLERSTLPTYKARVDQQETHVRHYLATQDPSYLRDKGMHDLPHPSGELLFQRWQHRGIQLMMPAAVREPVPIPAASNDVLNGLPPPTYPVIAASPAGTQTEPWTWRSPPMPDNTLPVLRFRFTGALGDPDAALSMRIVSAEGDVTVRPDGPARGRWRTINVFRPAGEWWIELTDADTLESFALTAPVEMGWLSWATEKLLKFHVWILSAGLTLVGGGLLGAVPVLRRRQNESS
ncbi:hypothetical protein [Synoicihabitans lomoniglobus]|uniref:Uncharacterized protein n=1 Tax=Synoicihabitans lomoniglobus TaxID=2909285 RepID=A0AAF0CST5_9BACT|nr:hypothetical protein [Opitutaceae bacterium LMO-M01]WED67400.1 hypothetical protein PXH66_11125 [Opitutaceae bacterium LMO-M01]